MPSTTEAVEMQAKSAIYVRTVENQGYRGEARLYLVSEPVEYGHGAQKRTTCYLIVSATSVMFSGIETFIFPADSNGNIVDFLELDGSMHGVWDHELVLRAAGYEVATTTIDGELAPLAIESGSGA